MRFEAQTLLRVRPGGFVELAGATYRCALGRTGVGVLTRCGTGALIDICEI